MSDMQHRTPVVATVAATLAGALLLAARVHAGTPAQPTPLAAVFAAHDWIGTAPTASGVAGKVVVLDVFTVDCYNCQNVVPTLRAAYAGDRARGLQIIGIHSPETPAEKDRSYVERSLVRQGITWPVAIDNAFVLWKAYGITAWPTQLFFDRHGRLRKTIVGDSQDADVRATVNSLLTQR
jgi:peroxiredoxin